MRRAARWVALTVVTSLSVALPLAGVAAAGQGSGSDQGGSGEQVNKADVLATLVVENPNVEVKLKGEDAFAAATNGQQLRAGDTVRTDATGRAEVDYSADAYTRLDVNTTFKIEKLSEDQGERQVEGGLESGRTWNRTEAVTQSGSFEQSGASATAAVAGTAFAMTCTVDGPDAACRYQAIVHSLILTGKNGEQQDMTPLTGCVATNGQLCSELTHLTPEQIAANAWIQENLLRDLLERGYGPGPFVINGTLVIEDGVISFSGAPPPPPPPPGPPIPPTTPTTAAPVAPEIDDPPIDCELVSPPPTLPSDNCTRAAVTAFEPTSEIVIFGEDEVLFSARVKQNGASGTVSIVFDAIPDQGEGTTGQYCVGTATDEGGNCVDEIEVGQPYPADQVFRFIATQLVDCECVVASGTLVFHLASAVGASGSASIDVTVCGQLGCGGGGGGGLATTASGNASPRGGVGDRNDDASRDGDVPPSPTTSTPDPTVSTTTPSTTGQSDPSGTGGANTRTTG